MTGQVDNRELFGVSLGGRQLVPPPSPRAESSAEVNRYTCRTKNQVKFHEFNDITEN